MNETHAHNLILAAPKLFGPNFCFECGDGWAKLLLVAARQLEALGDLRASQVKEKFGTLRFDLDAYTPEAEKIIEEAEKRSAVTCEECGEHGASREANGWFYTRCDKCWGDSE